MSIKYRAERSFRYLGIYVTRTRIQLTKLKLAPANYTLVSKYKSEICSLLIEERINKTLFLTVFRYAYKSFANDLYTG